MRILRPPVMVLLLAAAALPAIGAEPATPAGPVCDRALGQEVLLLCMACHATSASEPMRTGPPLSGIYGKKAATTASAFRYSPALGAAGLTWDDATLDRFLANPGRTVPGTLMAFPGLKAAADRAAAICMLRDLALPKAP